MLTMVWRHPAHAMRACGLAASRSCCACALAAARPCVSVRLGCVYVRACVCTPYIVLCSNAFAAQPCVLATAMSVMTAIELASRRRSHDNLLMGSFAPKRRRMQGLEKLEKHQAHEKRMEARDGVVEMSAEERHNEISRVISLTGRYTDIRWCMFRPGVGASTGYAFSLVMSVAGSHDAAKFGVTGNPGWRMRECVDHPRMTPHTELGRKFMFVLMYMNAPDAGEAEETLIAKMRAIRPNKICNIKDGKDGSSAKSKAWYFVCMLAA